MRELDKVLDSNEKVLWEGKPQFLPYFLSIIPFMLFGFVFLVFGSIAAISSLIDGSVIGIIMPHFWIGAAIFFGSPLYRYFVHKFIYYVITDKRMIFQHGLIGRDFKFIDYNQVTNAEVRVGILDKMFGKNSGSILISSPGTFTHGKNGPVAVPYIMENITDPYEVFKFFKKVSYDVKTDVYYPNQLRPDTNPGFQTSYDPNQTPK